MKKRRILSLLICVSLTLLFIGTIPHNNPIKSRAVIDRPWISLKTELTTNSTEIGTEIIVDVLATNNGEGDAYNVTIFQPIIYNWTFDFFGPEQYSYSKIPANSSRSLSYSLVAKVVGHFTLLSKCVYYDEEDQKYTTFSNELELGVVESEIPPEDMTTQWLTIISIVGIMTLVLMVVRLVLKK
ncbi:MAG: hypothetical protein ACFFBD_14580 [Candidatus Hodarchaeota archaeon]